MLTSTDYSDAERAEDKLFRTIGAAIWPRPYALVFFVGFWALFHWSAATPVLQGFALVWLMANVMLRPTKFGHDIAQWFGWLPNRLGDLVGSKPMKSKAGAPPASAPILGIAALPSAPVESPPPEPEKPKTRLDWAALFNGAVKALPFAGAVVVALLVWKFWAFLAGLLGFHRETAAEVRAEVRADVAESETRAAAAQAHQAERATTRIETYHQNVTHIAAEGESARETIAAAPDLESGIAAHRLYVERLRDEDRAARAAALSDFDSSLDP